jgi:hypothetical protein
VLAEEFNGGVQAGMSLFAVVRDSVKVFSVTPYGHNHKSGKYQRRKIIKYEGIQLDG